MTKSYTFHPELYPTYKVMDPIFASIKYEAMVHEYKITGMTCQGCASSVKNLLKRVAGVKNVSVSLESNTTTIEMDHHISSGELQNAFKDFPKYSISEIVNGEVKLNYNQEDEGTRSFWETYKPIILVFTYITGITFLVEFYATSFHWMHWMTNFMAGFFLVFSFFKLLNLSSFASSYSSYDVVAKKWYAWGYIYPFVELILGILFLTQFQMLVTNAATFVIMGISSIGVIQSLLKKRKIRCACLGAVFNLPMSSITLIEDLLMVVMSAVMIFYYL